MNQTDQQQPNPKTPYKPIVLEDLSLDDTKAETLKGGAETVHLYLKSTSEDIQGESASTSGPKPTSLGIN